MCDNVSEVISAMTNTKEADYVEQFEKLWQEVEAGVYPSATNHPPNWLTARNCTPNSNQELSKRLDSLRIQISQLKACRNEELQKQIDALRIEILELKATKHNELVKQVHILRSQIAELMVNEGVKTKEIDELTYVLNPPWDDEMYLMYGI